VKKENKVYNIDTRTAHLPLTVTSAASIGPLMALVTTSGMHLLIFVFVMNASETEARSVCPYQGLEL
jgi:hypothetical protein